MTDEERARWWRDDLLLRRSQIAGRRDRVPITDRLRRAFRVDDERVLEGSRPIRTPFGRFAQYSGYDLLESPHLPVVPDDVENVKRIVRHGLAEWVHYIGEEVGPKPGEAVHVLVFDRYMLASAEALDRIKRLYAGEKVTVDRD